MSTTDKRKKRRRIALAVGLGYLAVRAGKKIKDGMEMATEDNTVRDIPVRPALSIRKSTAADIPRMLEIYDLARQRMRDAGNPTQWANGYPSEELLRGDIADGVSYVVEHEGAVVATFALIFGIDPTYVNIFGGQWLNDEPYATIHRIGSDASVGGVLEAVVEFSSLLTDNIRIDTHRDNGLMNHLLTKQGFTPCGIIYIYDGTPRIAYQKIYRGAVCPICGKHRFTEKKSYEICPVCGWEDDPVQSANPDFAGGANKESLNQAKKLYAGGSHE